MTKAFTIPVATLLDPHRDPERCDVCGTRPADPDSELWYVVTDLQGNLSDLPVSRRQMLTLCAEHKGGEYVAASTPTSN